MKLLEELNRRNVTKVAAAYIASAWVIVQVLEFVIEALKAPDWVLQFVLICAAIGLIPALIFSWAFEITPSGIRKEADASEGEVIPPSQVNSGRRLNIITICLLLVAIGLGVGNRWFANSATTGSEDKAKVASNVEANESTQTVAEKSIAVLPFVNMSSSEQQDYFSDGITEEILNVLAKVNQLKVTGRTSSFAFKNKNIDLREIGEQLGVAYLLEGSVRNQGTKVRITAQLISVADGFHLWSETYDRELDDVFAIQDEIAVAILKQLKTTLLSTETTLLASSRTDPEAYRLYLLAKHKIFERTATSLASAIEDLDQALSIDPSYAPAYAQRATAELMLSDANYGETSTAAATMRAKRFLDQALALDPELAEGWAAQGLYHADRREHEQAITALKRARDINPSLLDVTIWLSRELGRIGEARAAQDLREEVLAKDPLFPPAFSNAVLGLSIFGETDKAFRLIERIRTLQPDHSRVDFEEARTLLLAGDTARALPIVEVAVARAPSDRLPRTILSIALELTHQWERLVEEGVEDRQVRGLFRLGRVKEARDLAETLANKGSVAALFWLNSRTQQHQNTIDRIQDQWPTLDEFMAKHPAGQFGDQLMIEVAYAYQQAGDATNHARVMQRIRRSLNKLSSQGVDNVEVDRTRSAYYGLRSDTKLALQALDATIERAGNAVPLTTSWPMLGSLKAEAEFLQVEEVQRDKINAHREELGLPNI